MARQRNREYDREYGRRYYAKHQERLRQRAKVYRTENVERYRATVRRNRQRIRDLVAEAKDRPCADCGQRYPTRVMEFDHVKGEKLGDVGAMASSVSKERLLAEIAKCEVVCANCHRLRHDED